MAEIDWQPATGSASTSAIAWTAGRVVTPPNGGGLNTLAFNALQSNPGVAIWYINLSAFIPAGAGGVFSAVLRRFTGGSGGNGWSSFIWLCGQGTNIGDSGYLLGLTDGNPGRIVMRKGALSDGVPDQPGPSVPLGPLTQGVLRRSTDTIALGTDVHLRLSAARNPNGEVVLRARRNNLEVNAATSPVWEAIPGMDDFIDDSAGMATGTASHLSGYWGIGARMTAAYQRCMFDVFRARAQQWP